MTKEEFQKLIKQGIPEQLPEPKPYDPNVNHAPVRRVPLNKEEKKLAVKNALRYFPKKWHKILAKEFAEELDKYGHIYMYRFRPDYPMFARPIDWYPAKTVQAAAIMLMIQNNLDPNVAQHPHELITYGGNGSVFSNWAQYLLTMKYLSEMTDEQTLVMYSGHPLGLFPSHKFAPRVVVTNGLMVPNYSKLEHWEKYYALGVTQYGQMTAGSYMYIGSQGIVHGTTITILNAGRKVRSDVKSDLRGMLFVSSGLGGMSGAQPKAAFIAGATSIVAEVNPKAAEKRLKQGWLHELYDDLDKAIDRALKAQKAKEPVSVGYLGNVVELWERLVELGVKVDLGSDQTSLHNPYSGGYYPVGLSFEEANEMMVKDPEKFKEYVHESLRRQVKAINEVAKRGMYFWDYGNAFLLQSSRAGADILNPDGTFKYPSYVEDIMGPLFFDYGFGPFRWVCTSGDPKDLEKTDQIALDIMRDMASKAPDRIRTQMEDNIKWIEEAGKNNLVIGSQARILYSNAEGRIRIAEAFNKAVASGYITAPIVIGRDHHDVSGTDSPFRETANIYDGSRFTADMATHNVIGDAFRGATWVSLHNGGGVGWGEVINGGFGMVLDGSKEADLRLKMMLFWDVNNGIARRAWARNDGALYQAQIAMDDEPMLKITMPNLVDDDIVDDLF